MSVNVSDSNWDKDNVIEGVKSIQASLPVLPPTQFPQPSIKASPSTIPLQSTIKEVVVTNC